MTWWNPFTWFNKEEQGYGQIVGNPGQVVYNPPVTTWEGALGQAAPWIVGALVVVYLMK